jgi:hypothetical protein
MIVVAGRICVTDRAESLALSADLAAAGILGR